MKEIKQSLFFQEMRNLCFIRPMKNKRVLQGAYKVNHFIDSHVNN